MAEIIVKVGDSGQYKDGDIICAFNDREIQRVHAEVICNRRYIENNEQGLVDTDTVLYDLLFNTKQFQFERISKSTVLKTDLFTGETQEIGATPNADGEHIDVPLFIARRLKHPRHRIFGGRGAEVWFGGKTDNSQSKLDAVWTKIEEKTDKKKSDHTLFPLGTQDKKSHLPLPVDNMTDEKMADLVAPKLEQSGTDEDGNPIYETLAKRKNNVDWKSLFPMEIPPTQSRADVEDKTKEVDARKRAQGNLFIKDIVTQK